MSNLTINDINQAIMFNKWTNENLESMIMAVKFARSQLGKRNKNQFTIGDTVQFRSRDGRSYRGTVQKIMTKNITVKTNAGLYRVPANMLEAA